LRYTAPTSLVPLSLHDALPISGTLSSATGCDSGPAATARSWGGPLRGADRGRARLGSLECGGEISPHLSATARRGHAALQHRRVPFCPHPGPPSTPAVPLVRSGLDGADRALWRGGIERAGDTRHPVDARRNRGPARGDGAHLDRPHRRDSAA